MCKAGHSRSQGFGAKARWWLGVLAVCVAALAIGEGFAGTFEVRNAAIEHNEQNYLLSAQIQLPVDDPVRVALRQGLPLKLELEIEVSRPRRFWPDATLATATEQYALTYHAVTDRYRVEKGADQGPGSAPSTFADLDAALASLGRIDKLAIVEQSKVDDARRYNVNVRATISVGDLPATLKILMFWREDWKRSTEWYTWPLSQ
jgi:Domain of unknown function (DUF4390)